MLQDILHFKVRQRGFYIAPIFGCSRYADLVTTTEYGCACLVLFTIADAEFPSRLFLTDAADEDGR